MIWQELRRQYFWLREILFSLQWSRQRIEMVLKDIAFVISLVIAVKNIEGMQYTEFNYAYATKITETKLIPLTCIYDQFFSWLGTETSIYKKGDGVILSLWAYTSLFVKWCGHARVFHMWVRCMWTTFLYISVRVMVLNATFNNSSAISWWSVLFVEDTGVPEENYRPAASHWQTLSQVI